LVEIYGHKYSKKFKKVVTVAIVCLGN